ncbi:MAG: hypothetical protein ICV69_07395 [Thermoleophilaceae bacterium]|nr:hypothetical protein [Thermoleophilaceae bacterium]
MGETGETASTGDGGAVDEKTQTPSAAAQERGPAAGGDAEPVVTDAGGDAAGGGGRAKAAAVAAGTGAAVAGIAGGIAVAARDTRRRVLGLPIGKRSRVQRAAGTVVDKAQEPAKKLIARVARAKSG